MSLQLMLKNIKNWQDFFQIKALPTIKIFPSDLTKSSGKEGEFYKQPVDYEGPRSASSLASWAISQLPNYVAILSDSKNAKPFFEQPPFPKVLLFTEKDEVSPLLKSLAIDFKYRLSFGQVKSTETALVARYEVQKIPTLLLATEDKVTAVYDGKLKHDPIFEWLSPHAPPPQPPGASQSTSQPKQKPPEKRTPEVVQITDQKVMDSKCPRGLCMLFFLDPTETEDHNRYLELLTSLSKKYLSSFRIMWVDVTKKPNFVSQFDLASGFPQAIILAPHKSLYVPFLGYMSEESIDEWADLVLKGKGRKIPLETIPRVEEDAQVPDTRDSDEKPPQDEL